MNLNLQNKGKDSMNKPFCELTYPEMLAERERVRNIIIKTKSQFTKKDFGKYLEKINKEISEYEKNHKNRG